MPAGIDRVEIDTGFDCDPGILHRAKQHAEQRGAMHGEAEAAAFLGIIAHGEHGAATRGIGAVQPVDAAAQRHDFGEQAEIAEHGQAGRLQDQPRSDRRRLGEPLEDGDTVPGAPEIERRRQARRPCSGDRYVENPGRHSTPPMPDHRGAARPNQAGFSAARPVLSSANELGGVKCSH